MIIKSWFKQYGILLISVIVLLLSIKFVLYRYHLKLHNESQFLNIQLASYDTTKGLMLDVRESREKLIEFLSVFEYISQSRNAEVEIVNLIMSKLPKNSILHKLEIKNQRAKLSLSNLNETRFERFCESLKSEFINCRVEETLNASNKKGLNSLIVHFDNEIARPIDV